MSKSVCPQPLKAPSLVLLASILTACGEEPPPPTEVVRAIRTITVAEPASGKMRRFSGVVEAASTSSLSFEVPGNVQEVKVEVGESVSQGQVLAKLDDQTFRLNVEAAQATVGRAEVELADADRESKRLQQIAGRDRGLVSGQMLDQAQANYEAARKNLSYTQSRLNLAKRDLERTVLQAPFDGIVPSATWTRSRRSIAGRGCSTCTSKAPWRRRSAFRSPRSSRSTWGFPVKSACRPFQGRSTRA